MRPSGTRICIDEIRKGFGVSNSKLESALSWAARGFRVFPLAPNTKDQPIHKGWPGKATSDKEQISAWWRETPDANIGCCTTGLVILDVDTKKGKRGPESASALGIESTSLIVRTPSNGFHFYYDGPDSANDQDLLGPGSGLDIRSHHGYVVAPGSTINGVPYVVEVDSDIEFVPDELADLLKPPPVRGRQAVEFSDDSEEALAQGRDYLLHCAPIAIEGQSGNATTYKVCAVLTRDFGLSETAAFDLLVEHWNPRCEPPWDAEELWDLVEHSSEYGTGEKGRASVARIMDEFGDLSDIADLFEDPEPEPPEPLEPEPLEPVRQDPFKFGNLIPRESLLARPWIYSSILMRGQVTQLVATGAGGKSSIALALAIHGALGLPFFGYKLRGGPFKSIVYNAEDDRHEQTRRFFAICEQYGFDVEEASNGVMLLCAEDFRPELRLATGEALTPNVDLIKKIMRLAAAKDVGMVALDPLVRLHDGEENDSGQMTTVISIIKQIAVKSNVGILLAHHTSKAGNSKTVGDADAGRGSSAITTHCRVNLKLTGMSQEEALANGISENDRPRFARLDDAKTNYSLRRGRPLWIKSESQEVPGLSPDGEIWIDSVGVPVPYDMDENATALARLMADTLEVAFIERNTGGLTIEDACQIISSSDPLFFGQMGDKAVRCRLESTFREAVTTSSGAVVLLTEEEISKGKKAKRVVWR
jgi:hypothetical protein